MARWEEIKVDDRVEELIMRLDGYSTLVAEHSVYGEMTSVPRVRLFMETHVFAVWDFMSLLSAIRGRLTCTGIPWLPSGEGATRRFINELFVAEDSDVHPNGGRYLSHFELYYEAMQIAGADVGPITDFTRAIHSGATVEEGLLSSGAPDAACQFVECTWQLITAGSLAELIGAFTFGRENVIPAMFSSVRQVAFEAEILRPFVAYLDRHIELDGEEHAPVAFRIVSAVCGDNPKAWDEAFNGAKAALTARLKMWESLRGHIQQIGTPPTGVPQNAARISSHPSKANASGSANNFGPLSAS